MKQDVKKSNIISAIRMYYKLHRNPNGAQCNANVSKEMLAEINHYCTVCDLNRSQFMRRAISEYLQNHPLPDEKE